MEVQLSICIPVFQREVHSLVQELLTQAAGLKPSWEIRLLDDGSQNEVCAANRQLAQNPGVNYRELSQNVGRSKIRNILAAEAKGQFHLFLDNDSFPCREDFLEKYWQYRPEGGVVLGGTRYPQAAPPGCELHHRYASSREQKPQSGGEQWHFQSNNFMIDSQLWQRLRFDESLSQYGHEDTLLGLELHQSGIPLQRIDNPVWHEGMEGNDEFLRKTELGLQNLAQLYHQYGARILPASPLLRRARQLRKSGLSPALAEWTPAKPDLLKKLILRPKPRLWAFDLYRLLYLIRLLSR